MERPVTTMTGHRSAGAGSRTDLVRECPTCAALAGIACTNIFNGRELPAERGTHLTRQVAVTGLAAGQGAESGSLNV